MRALPLLAFVLAASACGERGEQGMERADFVSTYIDLRAAGRTGTLDPATRDSILAAHGTSEEELRAFLEQRRGDPDALADTWREIMDSVAARDSASRAPDTTSVETDTL